MDDDETVAQLRAHILETLGPLIDTSRPVALLDYQDSMNAGDHAIWLGEKAFLRELGAEVAYECTVGDYDPDVLRAAIGKGQILLSGGGSFGDLYREYHDFRLRVLSDFPKNEVLVLPQTVMFYSDAELKQTVDAIAAHGRVTIAARDALSQKVLERALGAAARIVLAPDMALMLGPIERWGDPAAGVVWIHRKDKETRSGVSIETATGVKLRPGHVGVGPIPGGERDIQVGAAVGVPRLVVTDWYRTELPHLQMRVRLGELSFDERAEFWLGVARRLLSTGRVVISDRLHGHILSTLAGIPHVLLNNSYGKNFSYYETWSRPSRLCRIAQGPAHAWDAAHALLEEARTAPSQRRLETAQGRGAARR